MYNRPILPIINIILNIPYKYATMFRTKDINEIIINMRMFDLICMLKLLTIVNNNVMDEIYNYKIGQVMLV